LFERCLNYERTELNSLR